MNRPYTMPRGWMEHPMFACMREPFDRRSAFVWLVERANFAPGSVTFGGVEYQLEAGQLVASISYISTAWMWDACKVRRFLNRLHTDRVIDLAKSNGVTQVTICNYKEIHDPRHTQKTVADTPLRYNRHQTEEYQYNNVDETRSVDPLHTLPGSAEPCPAKGKARAWSPKVDHPDQLHLIDDTALAEPAPVAQLQAAPIDVAPPDLGMPNLGGNVVSIDTGKPTRCKATGYAAFDEFYAAYPLHVSRKPAERAYRAAIRKPGVTHAVIMAGVAALVDRIRGRPDAPVPYPATWLNDERWTDDTAQLGRFGGRNHGQRNSAERNGYSRSGEGSSEEINLRGILRGVPGLGLGSG